MILKNSLLQVRQSIDLFSVSEFSDGTSVYLKKIGTCLKVSKGRKDVPVYSSAEIGNKPYVTVKQLFTTKI